MEIEEEDERFSVEQLEKGERRLIIKKVLLRCGFVWFVVLRSDEE